MKIAITGATGSLGTALVRALLAADDETRIVGLARRVPVTPTRGRTGDRVAEADDAVRVRTDPGRLQWVSVDLTCTTSTLTLRRAFRGVDAVVHLAWGFQPSHHEAQLRELGVGGTRRVLTAAVHEGVPHVVHMSSVGAYSAKRDDLPVDETYPTDGIRSSMYSRHKVAAERLLDDHESSRSAPRITRLRPGIVGQRLAGSALARYGLPGIVPGRAVALVPVLPLDRRLVIPMVHAADVAVAVMRVLRMPAYGAFNLAAAPALRPADIGAALRARPLHVPAGALRAVLSAAWHARAEPLDPGWLDLAMNVPLLDSSRAERELGWTPVHDARAVLAETVAGLRDSASGPTAVLRRRSVVANLGDRVRYGAITDRGEP